MCNGIEDRNIEQFDIQIDCSYCQKKFTSKRSHKRHIDSNSCKPAIKEIKEKLDESLKREKELEIENKLLKEKSESTTVININNPTFIINGYQHTSLDHLKNRHYQQAINRMLLCVPTLLKDVHFSSRAPENHNIYISNIRGKYAMVWEGQNWEARDQDEMIDKLIMDNEYAIEEWLDEDKYPQEMKKFNEYIELKESPDLVNGRTALDVIREEVKLVLYNNRKFVKSKD